jgi:hypothetical protein
MLCIEDKNNTGAGAVLNRENIFNYKLVLNPKGMQCLIYQDLCLNSLYNLTLTINALFD